MYSKKFVPSLIVSLVVSTCIGMTLAWSSVTFSTEDMAVFKGAQQNIIKVTMYVVAIVWAQFCSNLLKSIGQYKLMLFGTTALMFASCVIILFPQDIVGMCLGRMFQGFGCASLAVVLPNYIAESVDQKFTSSVFCLSEAFILYGTIVVYTLSILVTWNQLNMIMTAVVSLVMIMMLLMQKTLTRLEGDKESQTNNVIFILSNKQNRRIFRVNAVLIIVRDLIGIAFLFNVKRIQLVFNDLSKNPISYVQCALVVTTMQFAFTLCSVFMIWFYGKKKLLLISVYGMLFFVMGFQTMHDLGPIIFGLRISKLVDIVLLLFYIIFYAQGIGPVTWAFIIESFSAKIRNATTGLFISLHFFCLMVSDIHFTNEEDTLFKFIGTILLWLSVFSIFFVHYFVQNTQVLIDLDG